jgi:glycosyltransferase involved in cell wall biosynthesis
MRIAFLCNNFKSLNGVERIWSQKLSLLAERVDDQIYLITYNQYGAPFSFPVSEKVMHIDLETRYISRCSFSGIWQYIDRYKSELAFRHALNDCLMTVRPDIVVCSDMHVANLKALLSVKLPVVRIVECHCGRSAYFEDLAKMKGLFEKMKQYLLKKRLLRAISRFDRIVVMTEAERADWKQKDRVVSIPNMLVCYPEDVHIDRHVYRRVITVGRYAYQKGYDLLLQAWRTVEDRHPDWCLDIYGSLDGGIGEYEQLQRQIESLGLHTVSLRSATTDIYSSYLESDIYVSASRFESFGLVLVEAMACGLPIVGFGSLYGPASIIKDGSTGVLVPPHDTQQLAEAICQMIEHLEERVRMGENGRLEARKYLPEQIMPLWRDFYESLGTTRPIAS